MNSISKQALIAFLLGIVLGAAGTRMAAPQFHEPWEHHGDRAEFQKKMMERFNSKLNLASDQRRQIAAILEEKRAKIDGLRTQMRPQFEEIRSSTRAQIRQLLSHEQQKRFDEMNAEHEARERKWRDRWDGKEDTK